MRALIILGILLSTLATARQPLGEERERKFLDQQRRWRVAKVRPARWKLPSPSPVSSNIHAAFGGFTEWARGEGLSIEGYDRRDEGVSIGDVVLRSGDILLLDQNTDDGVGLFSALVEEASLASHFGIIAFLPNENRVYPAVLDVYEHGVRATPLATFLSPKALAWSAVYRLKHTTPEWEARFASEAVTFLKEPHAYDLTAMEDNPYYLTCTTVGLHLLRKAGAPTPVPRSRVSPGLLRDNFATLHYDIDHILTPSDFARDENFVKVGELDTLQYRDAILNQLIGNYPAHLLRTQRLNPDKFPWRYTVNRWGLAQMKAGTWLGAFFLQLNGYTASDLPRGPIEVMAFYQALDAYSAEAGRWLRKGDNGRAIRDGAEKGDISMAALTESAQVRVTLRHAFAPVHAWFIAE